LIVRLSPYVPFRRFLKMMKARFSSEKLGPWYYSNLLHGLAPCFEVYLEIPSIYWGKYVNPVSMLCQEVILEG
jgi:hypothetical protein